MKDITIRSTGRFWRIKNIVAIIFLLAASQAQASFSAFVHVTPETENEYGITVKVLPLANSKNTYRVKVNAIGYKHKHAWLIITAKSLSAREQDFRDYIWQTAPTKKIIQIKAELQPTVDDGDLYYDIELSSEYMHKGYIYIDFPSVVFDGGYYFSIDLATYLSAE